MLALKVEVPIACFRQSRAREYAQTYLVPPPSTVYGMLLSMVGEMDRSRHCGVRLAIAMLSQPATSTVIRTFRRFKKKDIHDPTNARPDYQELLTDIQFVVFIDSQAEEAQLTLSERIQMAFTHPQTIDRFGGLCLGESRDLVNSIRFLRESDRAASWQWLVQDRDGLLTLPYWVDHVGSRGTCWQRYQLLKATTEYEPPMTSWTEISIGSLEQNH
jgi:CRISPR-associated protein Cas5t